MITTNAKHGFSDEEITRIWEAFRRGVSVDRIASQNGVRPERAERIVTSVMEVYEPDVPKMKADRRAGMSKTQIADKYGYNMAAVRYYLKDIPKGDPGGKPNWNEPKPTFKDEWNAICRKLNPKAWEGRE